MSKKAALWCSPAGLQGFSESCLILLQQLQFPPTRNTEVSPGRDSSRADGPGPSLHGNLQSTATRLTRRPVSLPVGRGVGADQGLRISSYCLITTVHFKLPFVCKKKVNFQGFAWKKGPLEIRCSLRFTFWKARHCPKVTASDRARDLCSTQHKFRLLKTRPTVLLLQTSDMHRQESREYAKARLP